MFHLHVIHSTKDCIKCTSTSWKMYKFSTIIYHHENYHYEIVAVIWFAVIDDSESTVRHVQTGVGMNDILSISDGSGKPFVIVLNNKNCISERTHCYTVHKKMIIVDLYMMAFVNDFWCC